MSKEYIYNKRLKLSNFNLVINVEDNGEWKRGFWKNDGDSEPYKKLAVISKLRDNGGKKTGAYTYHDIKNILACLDRVEFKNDNYVFTSGKFKGKTRSPERIKKIEELIKFLKDLIKKTPNGTITLDRSINGKS
jgi:hypothetical protein|tara:strand:+ start:3589 stop:3990 length:402 start_codon:yes stop_codon:yes gene_type:complete